jgi:uncharacterized protein
MRNDVRIAGLAVLAAELLASSPTLAAYIDGVQAYRYEQYGKAFAAWQPLAQKGDPEAEFSLGLLYYRGQGVAKNPVKAYVLFARAEAAGEAAAAAMLGRVTAELTAEQRRQAQAMLEAEK